MSDDLSTPSSLPPASRAPYPAQPGPRAHGEAPLPAVRTPPALPAVRAPGPAVAAFGLTLLGGAIAAGIGMMVMRRRKPAKGGKRKGGKGRK